MNYSSISIVMQEVPGEISICFSICGCKVGCEGCHSPVLWAEQNGQKLTSNLFQDTLNKYKGFASCVLFMGGEWQKEQLISYLKFAQEEGYKTCLYSGEKSIDNEIMSYLTWAKTGSWKAELGGLNSPTTNQQFIEVKSNTVANHLFAKYQ